MNGKWSWPQNSKSPGPVLNLAPPTYEMSANHYNSASGKSNTYYNVLQQTVGYTLFIHKRNNDRITNVHQ